MEMSTHRLWPGHQAGSILYKCEHAAEQYVESLTGLCMAHLPRTLHLVSSSWIEMEDTNAVSRGRRRHRHHLTKLVRADLNHL